MQTDDSHTPVDEQTDSNSDRISQLEAELKKFYQEREKLSCEIGCSDAFEVIGLYKSLEEQLVGLYQEFENSVFIEDDTITIQGEKKIEILQAGD